MQFGVCKAESRMDAQVRAGAGRRLDRGASRMARPGLHPCRPVTGPPATPLPLLQAQPLIKVQSPCAVDALQACLKEHKGDHSKVLGMGVQGWP